MRGARGTFCEYLLELRTERVGEIYAPEGDEDLGIW